MSNHQRITWYDRQRRRKSSRFFQLLNRSFRFRLFLAGAIALLLLASVNRFENCRARNYSENCQFVNIWSVISVNNIESFSIVTAAIVYILEGGRRKQKEHLEALEAINKMNEVGAVRSLIRIRALEMLSADGLWLDGLDLKGANLEQLEIPYAHLIGVNLSKTILTKANLFQADLTGANLTDADLTDANLAEANLTDADLTGANLTNTNLTGAILTRTLLDREIKPKKES